MKYIYSLSLVLALLVSCSDKKEKKAVDHASSDWAFYQLKGNVYSVEERSYELKDGKKGERKREIISEHDTDLFFNDQGQLIAEKRWMSDGTLFEHNTFKGREHKVELIQYVNGKPAIKTQYNWDKTGKENTAILRRTPENAQIDRITMAYKAGNLVEKRTFNMQDNPSDRIEYIYDAKGNVKEELFYLGTEYVQFRAEYEYNDKKQKISEARYNKDSKLMYKTLFKYENGRLVASETYNDKNEVDYMEKNSYDEKGNLVERYTFERFDNAEIVDTYAYDATGNKIQWTSLRNKKPIMKVSYEYDSHNNLTALNAVGAEGNIIDQRSYKYEYGKKGNWLKKIIMINQKPAIVVERTIKYYK